MIVITDEMVERGAIRAWCSTEGDTLESWNALGDGSRECFRSYARAVLEYAATLGPTREERLKDYRCAAIPALLATPSDAYGDLSASALRKAIADGAEEWAHAMLAAERPAETAPETDPFKLCAAAIRRVRDVMRAEPYITPEGVIEEFERATRRPYEESK